MKTFGFIKDKEQDPRDYIFGSSPLPKIVLQPDGQWDLSLPEYEPQAEDYETDGCTIWGTLNALEIYHKHVYGIEPNYSERYNYILAGIRPPGGNPKKAIETIKDYGVVQQDLLPVPRTYEEFIRPDPMGKILLDIGSEWLRKYKVGYEYIWRGNPNKVKKMFLIKDALRYSPVAISVTAWIKDMDVYVDGNKPNNHWCVCYGYTDRGWKIFDSYDHSQKVYSFGSDIDVAMRFSLEKANNVVKQDNWFIAMIKKLFK